MGSLALKELSGKKLLKEGRVCPRNGWKQAMPQEGMAMFLTHAVTMVANEILASIPRPRITGHIHPVGEGQPAAGQSLAQL